MLTYELDRRGNLLAYKFLYREIRRNILSGKLKGGEASQKAGLPALREAIAAYLGRESGDRDRMEETVRRMTEAVLG